MHTMQFLLSFFFYYTQQTCHTQTTGRRRRSSNIETNPVYEYKEETSSVSFTVADRFDGANGSEGIIHLLTVYFLQQI